MNDVFFDNVTRLPALVLQIALVTASPLSAQPFGDPDPPLQQRSQRGDRSGKIYRHRIEPHWIGSTSRFWYRNDLGDGAREFVRVDPARGVREPAFDHQRVAEKLGPDVDADRLPFRRLRFSDTDDSILLIGPEKIYRWSPHSGELISLDRIPDEASDSEDRGNLDPNRAPPRGTESSITFENKTKNRLEIFWLDGDGGKQSYGKIEPNASRDQHTFGGHRWLIVDENGRHLGQISAKDIPSTVVLDGRPLPTENPARRRRSPPGLSERRTPSPDGRWQAWIEEHNIVVQRSDSSQSQVLSRDGSSEDTYQSMMWSPDSTTLVAFKRKTVPRLPVHWIRSSPAEGGRAQLESRPYALPGDPFPTHELHLFRVDESPQIQPIVDRFEHEWLQPEPRFHPDGDRFTYEQVDRGHGRYRLIEVRIEDGSVRTLIDERSDTFIWTTHTEEHSLPKIQWLDQSDELLYCTEKYGWRQLILVDALSGEEKRILTPEGIVVRGMEWIDEPGRRIAVRASGRKGQDPYFMHCATIDLNSGQWVWITEENGNHQVQWSPDRQYAIVGFSRVDSAPVHQLRKVSDGSKVCDLETADIASLQASGWQPPEVFVAPGRDGKTDIWGIICRPKDFDPNRRYPVIEDIYAGPQGAYVPKNFSPSPWYESLTSLGFVVVKIDGMGTANRSKAFHDVCWKNLKDAGFPDRIAWMKAAAEKHPELDLSRVGIYGVSAGGQNAAGAVLFHPDFYKVAVAGCGCHDNRMDKASWNEQWMGYPVESHYADNSNIDNAHLLQGKLLLIVGEMDTNVPPESTLRMVDALIRADKRFELLVVPNAGHGIGGSYGQRRMHEFFVEHLLNPTMR
jgi:dipeptidyl aminopeptidase/acylaminoacyl peptidase